MRYLRFFIIAIASLLIWFGWSHSAFAENTMLVPCSESPAFQQRRANAPDTYYFNEPYKAYASEELCGPEGLPHLPLDRVDRAIDVIIPFSLFFYIAGFIGWSGRAYLQQSNRSQTPEMLEVMIDPGMAVRAISQGLLWPLLAVKEVFSGELAVKESEVPISPR